MIDDSHIALAARVLDACRTRGLTLATAESCTGGLIAGALTGVAGSSDVFDRGVVTYTNTAKTEQLGIPDALFGPGGPGAVSEETVRAMVEGALARFPADVAVAVTGIAGPGGGGPNKPVGLVHLACARSGRATRHEECVFDGDRAAVRSQTVTEALTLILDVLEP